MSDNTAFEAPPDWAIDAIWYQIFVERFRKGSDTNNPTKESIQYGALDEVPEDWCLTPWKHNWYKKDKYAEKTFPRFLQMCPIPKIWRRPARCKTKK
jgi:hypothetical protein